MRELGVILLLLAGLTLAHQQYQVPPADQETYETPPPPQQQQQSYQSPPPAPREPSYQQHSQGYYETPPAPCPNGGRRHPGSGECLLNECETNQHDCHAKARCIDTPASYTCACQSGYIDQNPERPGRQCELPLNNCASGRHGCSPDAVCTDTYAGVQCKCKGGYVDISPDQQRKPGRVCRKDINECLNPLLNDCSRDATCTDTFESYSCACNAGFKDANPANPGRECEAIPQDTQEYQTPPPPTYQTPPPPAYQTPPSPSCAKEGKIECDPRAICIDLANGGFTCKCPPDLIDKSPEPSKPGRKCLEEPAASIDEPPLEAPKGHTVQIPIPIEKIGSNNIVWSSQYNPGAELFEELVDLFKGAVNETIGKTEFGPTHLRTDIVSVSSARKNNSEFDNGALVVFNGTFSEDVNRCKVFDAIVEKVQENKNLLGSSALKVSEKVQYVNPCPHDLCGGKICDTKKGEVCINGTTCGIDFCSDFTCYPHSKPVNLVDRCECYCDKGYTDLRPLETNKLHLEDKDVCVLHPNWCTLGLHNCSKVADCIMLEEDYTCKCWDGYNDTNPEVPGRFCAAAYCGECGEHGACVTNPETQNVTCVCTEGYTGDHCEIAPSTLPLWLMLLLALLFLLLTLCCCLYACSRLRWFKRQPALLDQTGSSASDLWAIPRPKLVGADNESMGSGSSEFTIREEIERRVVTDVTRTEVRTEATEHEEEEHENFTHTQAVQEERIIN
ncbi:unnamed protein product [Bursaphelenchus xylophilus]|uniref:(pine wood nematode) hypothetical protein n=1 Tax=Bursaphelenchus xylophilus TaxID=6326 RepID=A0A1I7RPY1_BURXY|nr:unnamed protein product [Bursaphelenchus xylophilus]CAG9096810.1 unnamed protein product [Bursaphelenchus xylophilus]